MRTLVLSILTAVMLAYGIAPAAEIHVPSQAPTIQAAIDMASSGDVVVVATGTYSGSGNRDIVLSGKSLQIRSEIGAAVTIDIGATNTNSHRFATITGNLTSGTTIDGFTFSNGYLKPGGITRGGAIYIDSSQVSIQNCVFSHNIAYAGGAVAITGGTQCSIGGCTFVDNIAKYGGAASAADGSQFTISQTQFRRNLADVAGGGLDLYQSLANLSFCFLDSNLADYGGAVKIFDDAVAYLNNCTVTRNKGFGGAVITNHGGSFFSAQSIIAFNGPGAVITSVNPDTTSVVCSDVYGNSGGNYIGDFVGLDLVNDNFSVDPFFCDVAQLDFEVGSISPCLPTASPCGELVGSFGQGCTMMCIDSDGDYFGDPGHPENDCATDNCPSISNPDQLDADQDGIGDICDTCTDSDGDGFADPGYATPTCPADNCPGVASADQSDSDGDGLGDICDNCPSAVNADQADYDNDSTGDICDECTDTDGDEFGDPGFPASICPLDNCVRVYNPFQEDADSNGVGDPCEPVCGDANGTGSVTVSDVVYLINYTFIGGPQPDPIWVADVNCSGSINISDAVYIISFIFLGGPAPCSACP